MILKDNTENRALQDQLERESVEQEKLAKKLLKKKKMDRRLSDRSTSRLSTDNESVASTGDGEAGMLDDPEDTEIKFKKEADAESASDAETDTQTEPSNSPGMKLEDGLHIKDEGGEEDDEEEEEEICHEVAPLIISEVWEVAGKFKETLQLILALSKYFSGAKEEARAWPQYGD